VRLLLISILAAAAVAAQAATGGPAPPSARVTVIGDSIAGAVQYGSRARSVLTAGVDLDLQVAVCRRLVGVSCPYQGANAPTLVDLLPTLRLGRTVVVAVGYNDYEDRFVGSVETALQALEQAGVEHVLWLTLRAERQSYLHMNETIRAAAASHPEVTIVDWNLLARSHPDWFQPDGLHLTSAGAMAMATLIHRSLDELGVVAHPAARKLAIVTRAIPLARVGRPYAARLRTVGGASPIRWVAAAGAIPTGLRLRSDGLLTGTPRTAGRRQITLRATDVRGRSASRRLTIAVRST
jgi:hypothetical protein